MRGEEDGLRIEGVVGWVGGRFTCRKLKDTLVE